MGLWPLAKRKESGLRWHPVKSNRFSTPKQHAHSVVAILPARYASSRFPGKPLVDLCGKPMVQRVYEQAQQAQTVSRVLVATDDERIQTAVLNFGGEVVLTRPDHPTGTDRLAEVAAGLSESIIVNVQGDEPLMSPATIDAAVQPLLDDPTLEMATTCEPLTQGEDIINPNIVKVVCNQQGFALYFSRSVIPALRLPNPLSETVIPPGATSAHPADVWFKHTGLYVYRREFLLHFASLSPCFLEQLESLEQLRALYHGHRIKVVKVTHASPGVDTPEDADRVRALLNSIT